MQIPTWRRFLWWRWQPDGPLATNIIQTIAPRRADYVRAYREERSRIAEQMAARGTLGSGGFLAALHNAAAREVESYATVVRHQIVDTLTRVRGAIPRDSTEWVLATFRQQVGVLARQLADDVSAAEANRGVASHSGAALEAVVVRRTEELRLELHRRALASKHHRFRWVSVVLRHPLVAAAVGAIIGALLTLVLS